MRLPTAPRLTHTDAGILAATLSVRTRGGVLLNQLLDPYDYAFRDLPGFDDLSYGLPRLIHHGLLEVSGAGLDMRLHPTRAAREMARAGWWDSTWAIAERLQERLHATPRGVPEDRRLGRLPGLERSDVDTAMLAYDIALRHTGDALLPLFRILGRLRFW